MANLEMDQVLLYNCWADDDSKSQWSPSFQLNKLDYPIEILIAVTEQKHKFGKQNEPNIVLDVLNTIKELDVEDRYNSLRLWRQQNLYRLTGLKWEEFKKELREKFCKRRT